MPRTGRPPNPDAIKYWKISIPASLAGAVELALLDTANNRPIYGSRSELISKLLREWLTSEALREAAAGTTADPSTLDHLPIGASHA
jgi:metal-responsive CopG/Arc/MetJ family transcriptional regulator